jgi:colanic acid/amylovoran biosynthesis glycosyltransferase
MRAGSLRLLYAASPLPGKRPYDIIQCHFGVNGLKGALLRDAGAARGKLVTTFHGFDLSVHLRRHGRHVYDELFARGDLFLPVTERWKRRLVELGCPEDKIEVHRMGVDLEQFPFEPRCARAGERCVVVSVARLVEKKGIEYGIRAVAKLSGEGHNVEYRIVGGGHLKPGLRRLIRELGVRDVVKLLGWRRRAEIQETLRAAHVFLAPSVTSREGDEEGVPVAIMEAMATGLPVVGTHHSGLPEVIQEGVTGFLVPERDVDGLADRLRRLVERPQSRAEMGRNGRLFVEQHHDNNKLNDRLVDTYRRLLGQTN